MIDALEDSSEGGSIIKVECAQLSALTLKIAGLLDIANGGNDLVTVGIFVRYEVRDVRERGETRRA